VGDVDEFFMELRAVRSESHSTLLTYQNAHRAQRQGQRRLADPGIGTAPAFVDSVS
jgi:hypothetical protein